MTSPLIAVIEDEEHLAQGLLFNLQAEGFRTHHESDGTAALNYLLHTQELPAAVILDVMLPGTNGFAITQALRQAQRFTPVLLLTARNRSEDIVEGFAAGADDYLSKPFDLNVLLARLGSLLRRTAWQQPRNEAEPLPNPQLTPDRSKERIALGARTIDFEASEIQGNQDTVHLTVMEADLLRYLITHRDRAVSRKEILEEVWHVQADTDTRPIDNFIVRLRRYLEPDPTNPVYFLTARGVGYRFTMPSDAPAEP